MTEPSCGPGYTLHSCSKCGYEYIDNIIDPIAGMPHDDYLPWYGAQPSCGMGYTVYRCSICREYYKSDFVDALPGREHIYVYEGIMEPYCDIQGKSQITCIVCDEEIITYTDPLGHSFGKWQTVRETTDTDPGLQERACDRCGKKETRVPPSSEDTHEHEYVSSIVEPTCETKGYRCYQCECGSVTTDSPTPALGHKYSQWELNKSTGISTRTCQTCGKTETKGGASSDSEEKPSSSVSGLDPNKPVPPFTDVSKTDDSYEAICYVYQNNLFKGVSDTEFAPDQTMTRAMFVTVAGRHAKIDTKPYEKKLIQFEDVSQNAWYSPYTAWATENNIVKGYSEKVFGVDDPITVEQAAVILARYAAYAGYDTATADNGKLNGTTVSDWAKDAMNWAIRNDICTEELAKKPQNHSTREMVAQMLYRFDLWSKSAPKK